MAGNVWLLCGPGLVDSFFWVTVSLGWTVYKAPAEMGQVITSIGDMVASTSMLWAVALPILGVAVHKRSDDKKTVAGIPPAKGVIDGLAGIMKK
jgi:hypothetical protein